ASDYFAIIERHQFSLGEFLRLVGAFTVNVADGHDLDRMCLGSLRKIVQQIATAPANSDKAQVDTIVCAQNLRVNVAVIDSSSAGGSDAGFDEISARSLMAHANLLGLC